MHADNGTLENHEKAMTLAAQRSTTEEATLLKIRKLKRNVSMPTNYENYSWLAYRIRFARAKNQ